MAREPRNQGPQEPSPFDERVVHIDRVARVVKGGRRFRFRALVVVGDRKHKVGVGIAKGADVTSAVSKATEVAKKHLIDVPVINGTLPHEAEAKVGGARILVKPASAGTGLIAGGVVRTILEVAGVNNILSKSLGSSNKINIAYATLDVIRAMKPKNEWITSKNTKLTKEPAVKENTNEYVKAIVEKPVKAAAKKPAKTAKAEAKK